MINIVDILERVIYDDFYPNMLWYFDKKENNIVSKVEFSYENDINVFDEGIKNNRFVKLPQTSFSSLCIDFVQSLNNEKANDYLKLFGETHKYEGAIALIYSQQEQYYTSEGYLWYFCFEKTLPIVENWAKANNIEMHGELSKPSEYVLDLPHAQRKIIIPTDSLVLSKLVNYCLEKDMCFDKRTYQTISKEKANEFPYLDCIQMPCVDEIQIANEFMRSLNLKQIENIDEFKRFIDCNEKYDHELFDLYYKFKFDYMMPILIDWCSKNDIKALTEDRSLS